MNTKASGFTLLELAVVITLIAVLAAISVPLYRGYTARAQASELVMMYDSLRSGLGAELAQFGPFENCSEVLALVQNQGQLSNQYTSVELGFNAVQGGGYKPAMGVIARRDQEGEMGVDIARAAYETLTDSGRIAPGSIVTNNFVAFTLRISDTATPDCMQPVTATQTAAYQAPPTPPTPTQIAPTAPAVPQPVRSVVAPDMIDLDWYSDFSAMTRPQVLAWARKYMYDTDGITNQMIDGYYPGDRLIQVAQEFQTRHTPATVPQSVPTPQPINIPPLTQTEQDSVDNMDHDALVDWAIQNLYHGNTAMRPLVDRILERDLRRIITQAQQRQ